MPNPINAHHHNCPHHNNSCQNIHKNIKTIKRTNKFNDKIKKITYKWLKNNKDLKKIKISSKKNYVKLTKSKIIHKKQTKSTLKKINMTRNRWKNHNLLFKSQKSKQLKKSKNQQDQKQQQLKIIKLSDIKSNH